MTERAPDIEDLNRRECREIGLALRVFARHLRIEAAAERAGNVPDEVEEQCRTLEALADGFRRSSSLPYRFEQLIKALDDEPEDPDEPFPILWPPAYLQIAAEALGMLADLLKQSKDERAERITRLAELTGEAAQMASALQELEGEEDSDVGA